VLTLLLELASGKKYGGFRCIGGGQGIANDREAL
jgi:hypothetical protein